MTSLSRKQIKTRTDNPERKSTMKKKGARVALAGVLAALLEVDQKEEQRRLEITRLHKRIHSQRTELAKLNECRAWDSGTTAGLVEALTFIARPVTAPGTGTQVKTAKSVASSAMEAYHERMGPRPTEELVDAVTSRTGRARSRSEIRAGVVAIVGDPPDSPDLVSAVPDNPSRPVWTGLTTSSAYGAFVEGPQLDRRYSVYKAAGIGGRPIPDHEHPIVIREQDILAPFVIDGYLIAYEAFCPRERLDSRVVADLRAHREHVRRWQAEHPELVKWADR